MKCTTCPVGPGLECRGETVPRLCELARAREDYRRRLVVLAHPEWLAAVAACPDRGGVLPAAHQPEGCAACSGELSACRAGRGRPAGGVAAVTLDDCLACRGADA